MAIHFVQPGDTTQSLALRLSGGGTVRRRALPSDTLRLIALNPHKQTVLANNGFTVFRYLDVGEPINLRPDYEILMGSRVVGVGDWLDDALNYVNPISQASAVYNAITSAGSAIASEVSDLFTSAVDDVNSVIEAIDAIPLLGTLFEGGLAPLRIAFFPLSFSIATARGENVLDFTKREFGRVKEGTITGARVAETFGGLVPGLGTIIAAGGALVASVADGEDLTDIGLRIGTAVIPGGPLVAMGVRGGYGFVSGLIKGGSPRDALNDAVRDAVPAGPLRNAYDLSSALIKGQRIDDAVIDLVVSYLPLPDSLKGVVRSLIRAARDLATGAPATNLIADAVSALPISQSIIGGVSTAMFVIANIKVAAEAEALAQLKQAGLAGSIPYAVTSHAQQQVRDQLTKAGVPADVLNDIVALTPRILSNDVTASDVFRIAHDVVGPGSVQGVVDLASTLYSGHVPAAIQQQVVAALPQELKDTYNLAQSVSQVPNNAQSAQDFLKAMLQGATPQETKEAEAAYTAGSVIAVAQALQQKAKAILVQNVVDESNDVKSLAQAIQFDPSSNFANPADLAQQKGVSYEVARRALSHVLAASNASKGIQTDPEDAARVMRREVDRADINRYNQVRNANRERRIEATATMSLPAKLVTGTIVASAIGVTGLALYAWYNEQAFDTTARQAWTKTKSTTRSAKQVVTSKVRSTARSVKRAVTKGSR